MKRLLIVSPHFPPVNAPDMQRVRMSLPFFAEFGWEAHVLAVEPSGHETLEPLLTETVPGHVTVNRVKAMDPAMTRRFGFGNTALRALPFLQSRGADVLRHQAIDLVYFSTTMFLAMPLGRLWKARFGVPYVLDIQDPWLSDYYETHPEVAAPPKYGLARRVNAVLEPWTMKAAGGIIAVSQRYIDTLHARYPWLATRPHATLPFGASSHDFDVLRQHPQTNRHFDPRDGLIHGVYAGRGGDDMAVAADILFRAYQLARTEVPTLFDRVRLHFVGTDYATDARARQTLAPRAAAVGLDGIVDEDPARAPYFEALQMLTDAGFLVVLGSDDSSYSASKVYPYIMANRPLIAIVHDQSPLAAIVRNTRAGAVVTFADADDQATRHQTASNLARRWIALLTGRERPSTDWDAFERYSAREMTRQQCRLFDDVVAMDARSAAA